MIITSELLDLAKKINQQCPKNFYISTAESCTGGIIATAITAIPGASKYFDSGFITYSNRSKIDLLGVNVLTLEKFGAVSDQTAKEMAYGCLQNTKCNLALSVTGIAGPDVGTTQKPVGMVFFGIATQTQLMSFKCFFEGDRHAIRLQSAMKGLELILKSFT